MNTCGYLMIGLMVLGFWFGGVFGGLIVMLLICILAVLIYIIDRLPERELPTSKAYRHQQRSLP